MKKRLFSWLCALTILIGLLPAPALAVDATPDIDKTAAYLISTVTHPKISSTGGEWTILGLARGDFAVPQRYWDDYYSAVSDAVTAAKGNLHDKKYTEYSRVILALTAIGADPTDVAGYNLLTPLGDYEKTIWQGVNGAIWALIALDSGRYSIPENPAAITQATRQRYIDHILDSQLSDGGWSLLGTTPADPDITGMALQALANYQATPAVQTACQRGLDAMSQLQDKSGGFTSWETASLEPSVQMLVALASLDIPLDDPRFVKDGNTLLDSILAHQRADGSFSHTATSGANLLSTEQAYYALVAAQRMASGDSPLYQMDDVTLSVTDINPPTVGLSGKDDDVKRVPVLDDTITFTDIAQSDYQAAILALAQRGIVAGTGNGQFSPDNAVTRSQFATMLVRALGLTTEKTEQFTDVPTDAWFAPYVGTAHRHSIVAGRSETTFDPYGAITRQEGAVMVMQGANLCGIDTAMEGTAIRDTLAPYLDYVTVSTWAQRGVAFCYQYEILDPSVYEIHPTEILTRGEMAQMIYNLLATANLL